MSSLSFGYLLPTFEATGHNSDRIAALLDLGVAAEQAGFGTVWVPDSPFQYGLPDPLIVLAALAARTSHVLLGSGVLLAALRQPALLAQQLASLDSVAGGRLRAGFGLGFGSSASEHQFHTAGVAFATRAARLEESIGLMRRLWSAPGQPVTYHGAHVTVRDLVLSPAPARDGGPAVWLAGAGPRAEHRVGRLADGWLPYLPKPDDFAEGWGRVQAAAAAAGRLPPVPALYLTVSLDASQAVARRRLRSRVESWYGRPLDLIASLQAMYAGSAEGLAAYLDPYVDAGVQHVVFRVADEPEQGLEAVAAAIRRLAMPQAQPAAR